MQHFFCYAGLTKQPGPGSEDTDARMVMRFSQNP
jgi:hypothetical protein